MGSHLRQWIGGTAEIERRAREIEARCAELEQRLEERTKQLEEASKTLRRMATADALTGMPNHRAFRDFLENEWRRALREHTAMSLVLIDIDDFKSFNDAFGHQAGDECLRRVGSALAATAGRASDLVARYGGEEFVAVLGNTEAPSGALMAERFRMKVESLAIPHPRGTQAGGVVTVSVGVATMVASRTSTPDDLVGLTDTALLLAKRDGRNRVSGPQEGSSPARNGQILAFRPLGSEYQD